MGIVNRTPDSFFDGGSTYSLESAVSAALRAVAAGAGWVDIGGVPFSPDTPEVSEAEELDRVLPVVAAVAAASDVVVSVDTFRPEVVAQSIAAGAAVVNDTTGLHHPELAVGLGVPEERIVIDPGHDLNKNTLHTLELTRRLSAIAALGLPLLAAVSNKDLVGESTGRAKADRREASIAAATVCVLQGARIIRMHDVAGACADVALLEAVAGFRTPTGLVHNMS